MSDPESTIAPSPPNVVIADDAQALYCPSCGYDLRGATSDRCSECGQKIDRAAMAVSAIPWAHRKQIGRIRAFWRTVGKFTLDRRRLRDELLRPQSDADAQRFRFWNGCCVAFLGLTIVALAIWREGTEAFVAVDDNDWMHTEPGDDPSFRFDLLVPWSAGMSWIYGLPIYVIGVSFFLAGCGRRAYRLRDRSEEHRQRADAISAFASAPLAWWFPATFLIWVAFGSVPLIDWMEESANTRYHTLSLIGHLTGVLGGCFVVVAGLGALHRAAQWVARAHHGGFGRYLLGAVELLGWCALGVTLFIGVLPWCVGLWRIMLGSWES